MKKIFLMMTIFLTVIFSQNSPRGSLSGTVKDFDSKMALIGVNIYVTDQNIGAATNADGYFSIQNIPVGSYSISISYIGYKKTIRTDVIIRPGRNTELNVELYPESVEMENVVVTGGYFTQIDDKPLGSINYSAEEVRRAPGVGGDISRILNSLPSLSKVNDQRNSLIVRGGSPLENTFILDNIEIPNINHFPVPGASGGGIALVDVDFLDNVIFSAGGFSAKYGDRLSSVMEMSFREGDKNNFYPQINLSMKGAGFSVEGPIAKDKASFLFSANRSYYDLILDAAQAEGAVPTAYDFQGKISWDVNNKNKLSMITLFAHDKTNLTHEKAFEAGDNGYGLTESLINTTGINWQYLWNGEGYSNTSVAATFNRYNLDFRKTNDKSLTLKNDSEELLLAFRNSNYYKLRKNLKLEFGLDLKYSINNYKVTYGEVETEYGVVLPELILDGELNTLKSAGYLSLDWTIREKLTISSSIRVDNFDYNKTTTYSPRGAVSYRFNDVTSISFNAGIYYQNLPGNVLVQSMDFKNLETPKTLQISAGFTHLLSEDTKLSIEVYNKEYENLPVNPETPADFLFDQVVYGYTFRGNEKLVDGGKAWARGIELMVQKKLAKDFYGLVSASFSRTKYKSVDDVWRDRVYDNKIMFAIEGGYKPNESWEFSGRWIYAGGAPYTPFDKTASEQAGRGIYNLSKINGERLPVYHSLNLRADKRFHFSKSSLIIYLDVWNVYGRENIANYEWSEITNKQSKAKQWSTLPVLGIEYEF